MSNYKIGYARVSTKSQSLEIQVAELEKAGCDKIYSDKASGKNIARPGFEKLTRDIRPGDTVIVCKLDRLGRDLQDLISIVNLFNSDGIGFIVLNNKTIDTTTSAGKLIFNVFASIAEYEREQILERTEAGRKAARARGRLGGRKRTITREQINAVTTLAETMPIADACKQIGITRQSYYRLKSGEEI